jgi:acetyl esterase/lipase
MRNEIDSNLNDESANPPPLGRWVSEAASDRFEAIRRLPDTPIDDVGAAREHYDRFNTDRLDVALELYPVTIQNDVVGGVVVHEVLPATVKADEPVLVCLHGGAFIWGAGAGALVEAVPVAAVSGLRVIAVDYRLSPEHRFPAAVEDVVAVIAALRAQGVRRIGAFGCSAGGVLTAQVTARLLSDGLAPPDAIAMLHGCGVDIGGDSLATAELLNGTPGAAAIERLHDLSYFEGTDATNPLVFPGESPAVLSQFPPAMLISGTRDFAASSTTQMHRRLLAGGRDAQLVIFDGMWHAHHADTDLPEARETFALLANFFRSRLS